MLFDKNNTAAGPCYARAQNNPILSQITMLVFFWQKQHCCRTILVLRKTQSYSFADHDAILFDKNNPAAEPFFCRSKKTLVIFSPFLFKQERPCCASIKHNMMPKRSQNSQITASKWIPTAQHGGKIAHTGHGMASGREHKAQHDVRMLPKGPDNSSKMDP